MAKRAEHNVRLGNLEALASLVERYAKYPATIVQRLPAAPPGSPFCPVRARVQRAVASRSSFLAALGRVEVSGMYQGWSREPYEFPAVPDATDHFFLAISPYASKRINIGGRNSLAGRQHGEQLQVTWQRLTGRAGPPCLRSLGTALEQYAATYQGRSVPTDAEAVNVIRVRLGALSALGQPSCLMLERAHAVDVIHAVALRGWLAGAALHLSPFRRQLMLEHLDGLMERAIYRERVREIAATPQLLQQVAAAVEAVSAEQVAAGHVDAERWSQQRKWVLRMAVEWEGASPGGSESLKDKAIRLPLLLACTARLRQQGRSNAAVLLEMARKRLVRG